MVNQLMLFQYIAHFIGDYYLQTGSIAKNKATSYYYTFLHSVLYVVPHYVIWLVFCQFDMYLFLYVSILAWSHCLVDMGKAYLSIHNQELKARGHKILSQGQILYVFDQLIHYTITYIGTILMFKNYSFSLPLFHLIDIEVIKIVFVIDNFASTLLCNSKDVTLSK